MILRRFIEHVRDQNWFAVGLDVIVVIVGIFLGMQVTDWNEERKEVARVEDALTDLLAEISDGADRWISQATRHREFLVAQRKLVVDISRKIEVPENQPAYQQAFLTIGHFPSVPSSVSVYRELQSSGRLGLIDPALRKTIEAYYSGIEYYNGQLGQFRASSLPLRFAVREAGVFSKYNLDGPGYYRVAFDFEKLAEDEQFVSDLVQITRNQMVFQTYRTGAMDGAVRACQALAIYLGISCEIEDVPELLKSDPLGMKEGTGTL